MCVRARGVCVCVFFGLFVVRVDCMCSYHPLRDLSSCLLYTSHICRSHPSTLQMRKELRRAQEDVRQHMILNRDDVQPLVREIRKDFWFIHVSL